MTSLEWIAALALGASPVTVEDGLDPTGPAVDVPPVPVMVSTPDYPQEAVRKLLGGRTVACFTVTKRGKVSNPQLVESSHKLFRASTLKAVRKSTFKPALKDNKPVAAGYCRTYTFALEERNDW